MKYFILAGEASGDRQASYLANAIRASDPNAEMKGWGGEMMEASGVVISRHYRELAFMGFVEVVKHLPDILRNFKDVKAEILSFNPDAVILVDYPGFNLRMATWSRKHDLPVYYYISPQLWAWNLKRIEIVRKAVRRMYVILPFEKSFYRKYNIEVVYIGHPMAQEIASDNEYTYQPDPDQIALLPGSRKHEVERMLPVFLQVADRLKDYHFTIAAVSHLPRALYSSLIGDRNNVELVENDVRAVLSKSKGALVTSGTATLETALRGIPQVVAYKGSPLSYQIAKRLIRVSYISLVNLIADKELVPECIQHNCTAEILTEKLHSVLQDTEWSRIREEYKKMTGLLLDGGGAQTAAADIIQDLTILHEKV